MQARKGVRTSVYGSVLSTHACKGSARKCASEQIALKFVCAQDNARSVQARNRAHVSKQSCNKVRISKRTKGTGILKCASAQGSVRKCLSAQTNELKYAYAQGIARDAQANKRLRISVQARKRAHLSMRAIPSVDLQVFHYKQRGKAIPST